MKYTINLFLYCIILSFNNIKAQNIFYQDIFKGGVTGAGLSACEGAIASDIEIHIENGSTIKSAILFAYKIGKSHKYSQILFENTPIHFGSHTQITQVIDNFNNSGGSFYTIHAVDIRNLINVNQNIYHIEIPTQNNLREECLNCVYGALYLYVQYENNNLDKTATQIIINTHNNSDVAEISTSNLIPFNINNDVGFAIHSDRIKDFNLWDDGTHLYINNSNLGTIGGEDQVNSGFGCGVKGHFYYQNGTLIGLDDDVANNSFNGSDGIANINGVLSQFQTNLKVKFELQTPNSIHSQSNFHLAYFLSHTTPCDTFSVRVINDTTICYGETLQLETTGGQAYEWAAISDSSAIDDISCTDCPNPIFSGDSSTTYTVKIWNTDSCSVVRPVRINVNHPQKINYYTGETKCGFSNGYIKSINLPDNLDTWYVVTPNNDTLDQHIGNTFTNLGAGDYRVFYIDTIGCKSEDTIVTVSSYINTIADFTVNPSTGSAPLNVHVENQSQNASGFEWFIDGVSNGSTPPNLFELSGEYEIGLITWDAEEYCADTTWRKIVVYDSLIAQIPNVFTANNDGINDFFGITVNFPVETELMILNRWGNVVFDWKGKLEKGQNNLWNGESKNGDKVSDGVYFYRIEFSQMEWIEKERKVSGYVHVYGD